METQELSAVIESILFVSGEPVSLTRLADVAEVSKEDVGKAIDMLDETYANNGRGLMLIGKDEKALLATRPDYASFVERFVKSEREEALSKSALETLAIVAYRGPMCRADIEAIRGVNSALSLRNLLVRGLVDRGGNQDDVRGYLYSASFSLLESLGISDISELPEYENFSKDSRLEVVASEHADDITKEKTEVSIKQKEYQKPQKSL